MEIEVEQKKYTPNTYRTPSLTNNNNIEIWIYQNL